MWCVVMAAEGSRASRWQQLSITQWHRTLRETNELSQTWYACQPARVPARAIAVLLPSFSREAASQERLAKSWTAISFFLGYAQ
jgi:hypothetical protein